jgi:hypothetical protein
MPAHSWRRTKRKYGITLPHTCNPSDRRAIYKEMRRIVIEHYGGKCFCCGEEIYEFLAIDHVYGTTKVTRMVGAELYRFILKNNFPADFRVSCHNCNMSRGVYGYCPHQKLRDLENQINLNQEVLNAH